MTPERTKVMIALLQRQLEVIEGVLERAESGYSETKYIISADEGLLVRWRDATSVYIREYLGSKEEARFLQETKEPYNTTSPKWRQSMRCAEFLRQLIRIATKFPDQLTFTEPAISNARPALKPESTVPLSKIIFVIHGRDELNRLRLEKHLRDSLKLDVRVMADHAAQGRTLIEKFEQVAGGCGYAICLLTPDDLVRVADQTTYAQGRPNAVFELGWFCGRIGRNKCAIVMTSGTKIHSDLDGVNRIEFNSSVTECFAAIESELTAAGLLVKTAAIEKRE